MSLNNYKPKNSDFWKWILYSGISLFIIVVGWSIIHMTPGLWLIALAMCGASAAVSFVYTVYTTVNASSLRRRAWMAEALIVVGLIANVIIHASLSRRYDVATQARAARHLEEEREQKRKELEHNRLKEERAVEMDLIAQRAELIERQRRLTESQNRQLAMLPTRRRQQIAPSATAQTEQANQAQNPAPEATPILPEATATKNEVVILSPEQIQEQAWWWVFFGIFGEVGMIGATFIYFVRGLIGDRNRNGVADWKEELDPEELLAKYPEDYRRLYGTLPKQPPGYVNSYPMGK